MARVWKSRSMNLAMCERAGVTEQCAPEATQAVGLPSCLPGRRFDRVALANVTISPARAADRDPISVSGGTTALLQHRVPAGAIDAVANMTVGSLLSSLGCRYGVALSTREQRS